MESPEFGRESVDFLKTTDLGKNRSCSGRFKGFKLLETS